MKLPHLLLIILRGLGGLSLIAIGSLLLFGGSSSGNPLYALAGVACYAIGLMILAALLRRQFSRQDNDVRKSGHKIKKINRS